MLWTLRYHGARAASRLERPSGIVLDAEPPDSSAPAPHNVPLDLDPIDLRPRGGMLARCGDCLVVANNRITIDLQGHSITGQCASSAGVTDGGLARDLTVVKDGSIASIRRRASSEEHPESLPRQLREPLGTTTFGEYTQIEVNKIDDPVYGARTTLFRSRRDPVRR
jgi:hypothetical protein